MPGFQQGFAFIVGVANYPNVRKLPGAVLNDAKGIAAILKRPDRGGYAEDHVQVLLDKDATRDKILQGLDWLAMSANATPNATAVFYFSGHGGHIKDGPGAGNYLIPFDTVLREIKKTAIGSEELAAALNKLQTNRVVIIIDACYSAGTVSTKGDLEPNPEDDVINVPAEEKGTLEIDEPEVTKGFEETTFDKLAQGGGRVILASSSPNETSLVLPGAANSLFTTCLLEAMDGKVGDKTLGLVRIFDLTSYVLDEVPARNAAQNPLFKATDLSKNFPLALLLGGDKSLIDSTSPAPSMNTPSNKLVPKQQSSLASPAVTMQLKNFMSKRLESDKLDEVCGDVSGYISADGFDETNASPELFGFDSGTLGIRSNAYGLQLNKLIDFLNKRYKLPYLIYALSQRFPGEKITDWQP